MINTDIVGRLSVYDKYDNVVKYIPSEYFDKSEYEIFTFHSGKLKSYDCTDSKHGLLALCFSGVLMPGEKIITSELVEIKVATMATHIFKYTTNSASRYYAFYYDHPVNVFTVKKAPGAAVVSYNPIVTPQFVSALQYDIPIIMCDKNIILFLSDPDVKSIKLTTGEFPVLLERFAGAVVEYRLVKRFTGIHNMMFFLESADGSHIALLGSPIVCSRGEIIDHGFFTVDTSEEEIVIGDKLVTLENGSIHIYEADGEFFGITPHPYKIKTINSVAINSVALKI